jgi:hypothetical protein
MEPNDMSKRPDKQNTFELDPKTMRRPESLYRKVQYLLWAINPFSTYSQIGRILDRCDRHEGIVR